MLLLLKNKKGGWRKDSKLPVNFQSIIYSWFSWQAGWLGLWFVAVWTPANCGVLFSLLDCYLGSPWRWTVIQCWWWHMRIHGCERTQRNAKQNMTDVLCLHQPFLASLINSSHFLWWSLFGPHPLQFTTLNCIQNGDIFGPFDAMQQKYSN